MSPVSQTVHTFLKGNIMHGMPGEGSTGTLMGLPEKKAAIVAAGIPLFELRKTTMGWNPVRDFGLYDVRVTEQVHTLRQTLFYRETWFKNHTAYIEFFPNKRGFLFGFCPDDPAWHNRVVLSDIIDRSHTIIERYHTQNGVISGKRMTEEIRLIRSYLNEWQVLNGNKVIFTATKKDEAEAEAAEMVAKGSLTDYSVCYRRKVSIQRLVHKYKSRWLESPEFHQEHMPAMKELIAKVLSPQRADVSHLGSQIISALSQMTPEQKAQLMGHLSQGAVPTQMIPTPSSTQSQEGKTLEELDWNTLRRIAKDMGINVQKLNKEEVISEIRQVQNEKTNEQTEGQDTQPSIPEPSNFGNPYDGMENDDEGEEVR